MASTVRPYLCLCGILLVIAVVMVRASKTGPASSIAGKDQTRVATPLGDVEVEVHNPGSANLAVCIHGMNSALAHEWGDVVAAPLAQLGYRVLVPNLHSNPRTKPGTISREDFSRVALALAGGSPAMWLGKSWGGANVAAFAADHPKAVERLVLDAPALSVSDISQIGNRLNMARAPLLLLWAEDDSVIPFNHATAWRTACSHAQLTSVAVGGHRILEAYVETILSFAKA